MKKRNLYSCSLYSTWAAANQVLQLSAEHLSQKSPHKNSLNKNKQETKNKRERDCSIIINGESATEMILPLG